MAPSNVLHFIVWCQTGANCSLGSADLSRDSLTLAGSSRINPRFRFGRRASDSALAVFQRVKRSRPGSMCLNLRQTLSGLLSALLHLGASACRFEVEVEVFLHAQTGLFDGLGFSHPTHRRARVFGTSRICAIPFLHLGSWLLNESFQEMDRLLGQDGPSHVGEMKPRLMDHVQQT